MVETFQQALMLYGPAILGMLTMLGTAFGVIVKIKSIISSDKHAIASLAEAESELRDEMCVLLRQIGELQRENEKLREMITHVRSNQQEEEEV